MNILPSLLGTLAGICIATGIIFLFTGLRRPGRDRLSILFGLFALAYAPAIGVWALVYMATSLNKYLLLSRVGGLGTLSALVLLMWFVAEYTDVRPRWFLVELTSVFALLVFPVIFRSNYIHGEIFRITQFEVFWGESITLLDANESY